MDKINWKWILYAVLAIIVLRAGGIISSFWLGVGIAGLVVIFALIQELPGYKKFITILFALWILFFILAPPFIKLFKKDHPDISLSYSMLTEYQEKMAAVKIKPKEGKIAEYGGLKFCEDYEKIMTKWYGKVLEYSRKNTVEIYPSNDFSRFPWLSDQQKNLLNWPKHIKKEREECDKIARLSIEETDKEKETEKADKEYAKNIFIWLSEFTAKDIFWIVAAIIVIIILINYFAKKDGKMVKIKNAVVKLIFLAAVLFLAYHLLWGGLGTELREYFKDFELPFKTSPKVITRHISSIPKNQWIDISEIIPVCYNYALNRNVGVYEILYSDNIKKYHYEKASGGRPMRLMRIDGDDYFIIEMWKMKDCSKTE